MELTVQEKSNSTLDTRKDTCLDQARRDPHLAAFIRGRDLSLHTRKGHEHLYYLHHWSMKAGVRESISLISLAMARCFLEERGLICDGLADQRGAAVLRSWGYGILEEFSHSTLPIDHTTLPGIMSPHLGDPLVPLFLENWTVSFSACRV